MYSYTYIDTYINIYTYAYRYKYLTYIHTHIYIYAYMHTYRRVYLYTSTYLHISIFLPLTNYGWVKLTKIGLISHTDVDKMGPSITNLATLILSLHSFFSNLSTPLTRSLSSSLTLHLPSGILLLSSGTRRGSCSAVASLSLPGWLHASAMAICVHSWTPLSTIKTISQNGWSSSHQITTNLCEASMRSFLWNPQMEMKIDGF